MDSTVASSTVYNTIKLLEERINKLNNPEFKLIHYPNGLMLFNNNHKAESVQNIKQNIIFESHYPNIIFSIFTGKFVSVRKYALDNFISESTVRRKLTKLRVWTKQFGISISKNTIEYIGDEVLVRNFMCMVMDTLNKDFLYSQEGISFKKNTKIAQKLVSGLLYDYAPITENKLASIITLSSIRSNRGKHVTKSPMNPHRYHTDHYNLFVKLLEPESLRLNFSEYDYLSIYIIISSGAFTTRGRVDLSVSNYNQSLQCQKIPFSLSELAFKKLTKFASNMLIEDKDQQSKCRESLFNTHDICMLYSNTTVFSKPFEEIVLRLEKNHPLFCDFVEEFFKEAAIKFNFDIKKYHDYLLLNYFDAFSYIVKNPIKLERAFFYVLYTDLPMFCEQELQLKIETGLQYEKNMHRIYTSNLDVAGIELVLTTVPVQQTKQLFPNANIISVPSPLDNESLGQLNLNLNNTVYLK
ncbi:M protein trans-acting positive regulator [Enterococcus faecalis RP2S-4]|uniref:M protein trans-acting positive regulator n=2 Tax=Enterococcus faecalis TaxID=1351 RepID=A0ABC9TPS6_ENTFL|nr:M protein trans-acting positive regulator [Enterococcus faecalis RP2S-4]